MVSTSRILQLCDRLSPQQLRKLSESLAQKAIHAEDLMGSTPSALAKAHQVSPQKTQPGKTIEGPDGKRYKAPARPRDAPSSGGWMEASFRYEGKKSYGPYWVFRWGKGPGKSRYLGKGK